MIKFKCLKTYTQENLQFSYKNKKKIVIIYENFVFMIRIDPIPLQFGLASVVRVLGLCASY